MTKTFVQDFAPTGDDIEQLLGYPFARPDGSFITDGTEVTTMPDSFDDFQVATDAYLQEQGLPLLKDRIPVIAYGANRNPLRLAAKMAKYGGSNVQHELQTVPNIVATLPDTLTVWHGRPGQKGSTFAELYKDDQTVGEASKCHVAFMTSAQLALLHATEGATYYLAHIDVLAGTDHKPLQAVAYLAGDSTILLKGGRPLKVRLSSEPGDEQTFTAEEAVDYMLHHAGGSIGDVRNAKELITHYASLPLAERKQRQTEIGAKLGELGLSQTFQFPFSETSVVGRADFNLVDPNGMLHLAEESLAPIRPTAEEIEERQHKLMAEENLDEQAALEQARKQLDIMTIIRTRANAQRKSEQAKR